VEVREIKENEPRIIGLKDSRYKSKMVEVGINLIVSINEESNFDRKRY
jgi:hypothetical protein